MRFKLDENLPFQLKDLFTGSGHDAVTVLDEGIGGATDAAVARACIAEERALVTQDLDFADIRAYPPGRPLHNLSVSVIPAPSVIPAKAGI